LRVVSVGNHLSRIPDKVASKNNKKTLQLFGYLHRKVVKRNETFFPHICNPRSRVVQLEKERSETGL
jgi:hypothetical protein